MENLNLKDEANALADFLGRFPHFLGRTLHRSLKRLLRGALYRSLNRLPGLHRLADRELLTAGYHNR
jgi:hypothetical protein